MQAKPNDRCAVYRMFDVTGTLIYVGVTHTPERRIKYHRDRQPWCREIDKVEIQWFPDRITARREEASAILNEAPLYARIMTADPDNCGKQSMMGYTGRTRGDGIHCPKCGELKENPKRSYCKKCASKYQISLRLRKLSQT